MAGEKPALELEPYLHFTGSCEEALHFYARVFGGEITALMRYDSAPDAADVPLEYRGKVMHANFKSPTLAFMASDGRPGGVAQSTATRITLALSTRDVAAADSVFRELADGGEVTVPLHDTPRAARFGVVTDRFGIAWMINAGSS